MLEKLRSALGLPQPYSVTAMDAAHLYDYTAQVHAKWIDIELADVFHVFLAKILLAKQLAWLGVDEKQVAEVIRNNPYRAYVLDYGGYENSPVRLRMCDRLSFVMAMQQLRRQADNNDSARLPIRKGVIEAMPQTKELIDVLKTNYNLLEKYQQEHCDTVDRLIQEL